METENIMSPEYMEAIISSDHAEVEFKFDGKKARGVLKKGAQSVLAMITFSDGTSISIPLRFLWMPANKDKPGS